MVDKTRYPPGGVSAEAVQEIRRVKARVDAERLPRGADPNTHTKLGRGGLADIEWTVQLLQLRHAHKVPALHNTSTLDVARRHRRRGVDRRGRRRAAAAGVADGDPGAQCAGAGARQAHRPAARPGPSTQRRGGRRGLGQRRRRRVPRQLSAGDPPGKGSGTKGVRRSYVSMDFGFDVISAEEYERQRALYGPLTESMRRLIDAGIRTEVDEDTVREAQSAIEAVDRAARAQAAQRDVDAAA